MATHDHKYIKNPRQRVTNFGFRPKLNSTSQDIAVFPFRVYISRLCFLLLIRQIYANYVNYTVNPPSTVRI
jgi:hypothetical protein